jgi:hypothetical protein
MGVTIDHCLLCGFSIKLDDRVRQEPSEELHFVELYHLGSNQHRMTLCAIKNVAFHYTSLLSVTSVQCVD